MKLVILIPVNAHTTPHRTEEEEKCKAMVNSEIGSTKPVVTTLSQA
jgi:hypothetical protein